MGAEQSTAKKEIKKNSKQVDHLHNLAKIDALVKSRFDQSTTNDLQKEAPTGSTQNYDLKVLLDENPGKEETKEDCYKINPEFFDDKVDNIQEFDDYIDNERYCNEDYIEEIYSKDYDYSDNDLYNKEETSHEYETDDNDTSDEEERDSVEVNVGGSLYTVNSETLRQCPFFDVFLNAIADDEEKSMIFINRNGRFFEYILEYLIHGVYDTQLGSSELSCLKDEAEFYGLLSLANKINQKLFSSSTISTDYSERRYELLTMEEFYLLSRIDLKNTEIQEANTISVEYEVITTIHTDEAYWVCSRDISTHTVPKKCGKTCKNEFNVNNHGWNFRNVEKVVVATRE